MPRTFSKIYYHCIWSTKHRAHLITRETEVILRDFFEEKVLELSAELVIANMVPDHVHMLVKLSHATNISNFMHRMKGASSNHIRQNYDEDFVWQSGYTAYSVCPKCVNIIIKYIYNQKNHHGYI